MNIHFLETGFVDGKDQAADGIADQTVDKLDAVYDLSLGDRRGDVYIPSAHTGEILRIMGKKTMQKGGAAAKVTDNKKRFLDRLFFVGGEEDVIEPKTDPIKDGNERPNNIEECQKKDAFWCQTTGGVGCFEEGTIGHAPEKAEIVRHGDFVSFR